MPENKEFNLSDDLKAAIVNQVDDAADETIALVREMIHYPTENP